MTRKKKYSAVLIFVLVFLFFSTAHSQTAPQSLLIQNLLSQIRELQKMVAELQAKLTPPSTSSVFSNTIRFGMVGNEVKKLQQVLREIPGIYPEALITGYFGPLTKKAVQRFQREQGIEATGIVGPLTRARLNKFLASGAGKSGIIPQGLLIAPGIKKITSGEPASSDSNVAASSQLQIFPKPVYDLSSIAIQTQELINKKRVAAGISPLLWDDSLAKAAEDHSKDQAEDSAPLTNPELLCHYPLIRHEGFDFGFTLAARLENRSIPYQSAGENIAIVPEGKNFTYEYSADDPPPDCPQIEEFIAGNGSQEEITKKYNEALTQALAAVNSLEPATWVNKEWRSQEEIVEGVVADWLNSEGHRKNIMNTNFTIGGVGAIAVNDYLIFTHDLIGR